MEKGWFNFMVFKFKKELKRWYGIKKSIYSNASRLFAVKDILNFISGEPFLVRDSKGDSFSIYFDIENKIVEIEEDDSLYNQYRYNTQSSWTNHITSCIDSYLQSQICIDMSIVIDSSQTSNESPSSQTSNGSPSSHTSNGSDSTQTSNGSPSSQTSNGSPSSHTSNGSDSTQTSNGSPSSHTSNGSDSTQTSNGSPSTQTSNGSESSYSAGSRVHKYKHLWVLCDNEECYGLNYKQFLKERMYICEHCGYHLKMSSSERIDLLIDPGTWDPMDEDMVFLDPIEWDSKEKPYQDHLAKQELAEKDLQAAKELVKKALAEKGLAEELVEKIRQIAEGLAEELAEKDLQAGKELVKEALAEELTEKDLVEELGEEVPQVAEELVEEELVEEALAEEEPVEEPYLDRLDSYQNETGLTEAVQTGVGQLNGIPIAIGVMDFQFMGGSMGSAVGEKITRLIEYATNQFLPLIIVCASGGARMQEGSLSLMQMAKISSALSDYQSNKKLLYVSILTSPTTGGVTASFGMLGDIIIAEPNAYIAFAGKRVIEQLLNIKVPEGVQEAEYLFEQGSFDLIVPRNLLKSVLIELFKFHGLFPLNSNSIE